MSLNLKPIEPIELIVPTLSAVTTAVKYPAQQRFLDATVMATGLAGAETVTISFSADKGATFTPAFQDGTAVQLTATNNIYRVSSPLQIGVTKSASAAAVGVSIMVNQRS